MLRLKLARFCQEKLIVSSESSSELSTEASSNSHKFTNVVHENWLDRRSVRGSISRVNIVARYILELDKVYNFPSTRSMTKAAKNRPMLKETKRIKFVRGSERIYFSSDFKTDFRVTEFVTRADEFPGS